MPKRMLDDSYLNSPSLDRCSARAQDSFPRFILLADDFGCFEADARRLLALGWSSRRRDVTEALIDGWLEEYVGAGMAVLWTEAERRYCYLTGWNGPHGQRKRAEYDPTAPKGTPAYHGSKRRTPAPPVELISAVLAGMRREADGKPPGTARESTGKEDPENLSNSVPGREITGKCAGNAREIRGSAAPDAVPDAVPVPVAAAPRGPVPLPIHLQVQAPNLSALLQRTAEAGYCVTAGRMGTKWGEADALIGQFGLERALEECATAAPNSHGYPDAVPLAFISSVLRDAAKRAAPPRATPAAPLPDLDPEWLKSLPEDVRAKASSEWADAVEVAKRVAYPDRLPGLLAERLRALVSDYTEAA